MLLLPDFACMMRPILLLSIFFLPSFAIAQESGISTIDELYRNTLESPDSNQLLELNDQLSRHAQGNKDTIIFYAEEMIRIAEEIDYMKGVALGYNNLGLAYELNGDLEKGIENYLLGAEIAESLGYSEHTAGMIYNNISIAYSFMGEMDLSIEYLLKTIRIAEKSQDTAQMATAYNNLAVRHLDMNSPSIALRYLEKALALNTATQSEGKIGLNLENMGSAFVMLKKYDTASTYLRKSLDYLSAAQRDYDRLVTYQLLANMYFEKDQLDSAAFFNNLSLVLGDSLDAEFNQSDSKRLKAMLMMKAGNYDDAIPLLEEAQEYSESINYRPQMASNSEQLGRAYAAIGEYEKAQENYLEAIEYMNDVVIKSRDEAQMKLVTYQEEKKQQEIEALQKDAEIQRLRADRSETISWAAGISGVLLLVITIGVINRNKLIRKTSKIIEAERDRSDQLLLNILPADVADELREKGKAEARLFDDVTILFTDFKNFTQFASNLSPSELVAEIDTCYRAFDEIISKYGIEKIKTIGDAYMAASGLPVSNNHHAVDMVNAALEIRDFMANHIAEKKKLGDSFYEIRIGLHSGPVVAGIVGIKKFAYDIWGDTVNIASRIESNSEPGKINISESTYEEIKDQFTCVPRGPVDVKGKGELKMYFVEGPK